MSDPQRWILDPATSRELRLALHRYPRPSAISAETLEALAAALGNISPNAAVSPLQHNLPCSRPKGARAVVPKMVWIWLVKSVPLAVSFVNRIPKPFCSSTVNCCDHWQEGSAAGFCNTVGGVLASRIDGCSRVVSIRGTVS